MDKEYLKIVSKRVEQSLPDGYGFILLAASPGEGSRLVYTSNLERENAIAVLKEWMIRCSAEEDWMEHL